jgi:hypothetical protein
VNKAFLTKLVQNGPDVWPGAKILEKKNQNAEGSVDTKLWAGPSLKREYQICFDKLNKSNKSDKMFKVEYAFTLNKFFKTKFTDPENKDNPKYSVLKEILDENSIEVFYGSFR